MIFLESWSKPLLFLHLLAAVAATATSWHLLVRFVIKVRGRRGLLRLVRLHALILLIAYSAAFLLGAIIYPTFRVRVRHEYLDQAVPLATALFEVKEHLAALMLPVVLLLFVQSRVLHFRDPEDRRYIPLFFCLVCVIAGVLSFNAWCGWWLSSLRSL
ncbi:MAG: hypothetical protein HYV26_21440 [Candidatus Hydrogenedentes bacterium]|nr:hypothetical protein [Candidatus Hydrogenedentota bacterium]MBI3119621.1 hypothetical protein [Candidatus Hydrogenedentota bacterium]